MIHPANKLSRFALPVLLAGGGLVAQTTFSTSTPPTCQRPDSIRAGDLDGDGQIDVLSTHPGSMEVCVNRNLGGGTSWANSTLFTYGAFQTPTESVIAQLDGGGRQDVAVVLRDSAQIAIHRATGAWPGYAPPQIVNINQFPFEIVALDYDSDGDLDLAVACDISMVVHILENTGAGVYATSGVVTLPFMPTAIEAGDVNADGLADIVLTGAGSPAVAAVLVNTTVTSPTFAPVQTFPIGDRPFGVTIGDLNGDGLQDIATSNAAFSTMDVLLNDPGALAGTTVGFTSTTYSLAPGSIAGPFTEVENGDLDCDGDLDLAVTCNATNNVACFWNDGTGTFSGPAMFSSPLNCWDLAFADLSGNGQLDMATNNDGLAAHGILLNSLSTGCCTHVLIGGVADGFNTTSPAGGEESCPGAAALAWFGAAPRRDFDGPTVCNRPLLHTFGGIPGMIKSARLRMRMRADCSSSINDRIRLGFSSAIPGFVWERPIDDLTAATWTGGAFGGLSLDLGDLPGGTSLLSKMSTDGRLDILIGNDTAVDSIQLIVETCAPSDTTMKHDATPYITGTTWTWAASGAPLPAGGVAFFVGSSLGMGPVIPGGALCITSPAILAVVPTTAFGTASFSLPIPPIAVPACLTPHTQAFGWDATFTNFAHSNTFTQQIFD